MKKHMIFGLGLAVVVCFVGLGHATVINFDGLEDGKRGKYWEIPSDYRNRGLVWDNMFYTNGNLFTSEPDNSSGISGYYYGMTSEPYVALNGPNLSEGDLWGAVKTIDGSLFDFTGAYFSSAWNIGLEITVKGYYNANGVSELIASDSFEVGFDSQKTNGSYDLPDVFEPLWYDGNGIDFKNINYLKFSSSGGTPVDEDAGTGTQFVMDNFNFAKRTPIPEPATLLLLGLGLVALAGLSRKRKQNQSHR